VAPALDCRTQGDGRHHSGGAYLERRQCSQPRLGRRAHGARIRQAPSLVGKRSQPPTKPHPSLHQPAEPRGPDRNSWTAWRGSKHASQPRRGRSGSIGITDELRAVTERFLQGFGEVRALQTTIAHTYESDVLKPAREMAGLYAIIEGAVGVRDALLLLPLGRSREEFTASLVAANAFYLSLASDAADEARKNITTVEQTIPVMIDLAENDLQRTALTALAQRAAAFGDGL